MNYLAFFFIAALAFVSCQKQADLPKYSETAIPGTYTNQNGNEFTAADIEGKVVVTDFIFTHCPSICPKMAQQMKRVQTAYEGNDNLRLVSFSIDPERDTVGRLNWYANKIGADPEMWQFVTAPMDVIKETSDSLMVFQEEDADAPGGFNHQSRFILIDRQGFARGFYDGVNPEDVDRLINDIETLL